MLCLSENLGLCFAQSILQSLTHSDRVSLFIAFFLGTCALFVPYFAEIVKRKAFAPKLKILFKLAPPFCHKSFWRSSDPTVQINEPVYFFRFQVVNKGKTQAKLCEVVLENLWIYDSANKPQPYENFSPVNIKWGSGSDIFVDINPSRKRFCDIGYISSEKYQKEQERFIDVPGRNEECLRFMLALSQHFYSQPNCLKPGRYILQIGLYSENAGYQKVSFDISWSGKWQDGQDEMFREIVITQG